MPEPDCLLRYRMRCNAECYCVGKIPPIGIGRPSLQRGVVLKWFYLPRAVGTPLSEVHALLVISYYNQYLQISCRVVHAAGLLRSR